ncbi:hypothetical protein ACIGW3_20790 [Streptomyces sp. NPDC053499]|uniref:hypothetical protein n=1 Tax=Streptomyces sp. NPDC053499 TaxID=3365707 RepID=UPI0037D50E12
MTLVGNAGAQGCTPALPTRPPTVAALLSALSLLGVLSLPGVLSLLGVLKRRLLPRSAPGLWQVLRKTVSARYPQGGKIHPDSA